MSNYTNKTLEVNESTSDVLTDDLKEDCKPNKPFKSFLWYLGLAVVIFLIMNVFIFNAVVPTSSMEDTIYPGDKIFGSRLSYLFKEVERGDIVIFESNYESKYLVKRVIGLPGEVVDIKDGCVYIDGKKLDEPYLKIQNQTHPYELQTPYTVPDGMYLLLGDNRTNSNDGRMWDEPCISKDSIKAEVFLRYYPFKDFGVIN